MGHTEYKGDGAGESRRDGNDLVEGNSDEYRVFSRAQRERAHPRAGGAEEGHQLRQLTAPVELVHQPRQLAAPVSSPVPSVGASDAVVSKRPVVWEAWKG